MIIIKALFIFFLIIYSICKISDGMCHKYKNNLDRIMNIIEIVASIAMVFLIYKI